MRAKKSLGQHFLISDRVKNRVAHALQLADDEHVYEIGPGTGELTRVLVEKFGADRVTCVEQDREMIAHLARKLPDVTVHHGDASKFDWSQLVDGPAVVVGNLPYNIATRIYFHLLIRHRALFRTMVLMFQLEVAERLVATPGSKKFGSGSVMTRVLADARFLAKVPPGAFRPPPKVESAVIQITPLEAPRLGVLPEEISSLEDHLRAFFQQRRKTIRNNVKTVGGERTDEILAASGLPPSARAEALSVDELVHLWRTVLRSAP